MRRLRTTSKRARTLTLEEIVEKDKGKGGLGERKKMREEGAYAELENIGPC